jgi:hypothetical protein
MKDIKEKLYWLISTHLGRLLLGAILFVLGFCLSQNGTAGELIGNGEGNEGVDYPFYAGLVGLALLLGETLVMIGYAWFVVPFNYLKKKFKKKQ